MFYQFEHINSPEHFVIENTCNFSFPIHIHQCFEIITLDDGQMNVTIDNETYLLEKGDCILIFPNQMHSLNSTKSAHTLCIFSPEFVKTFSKKNQNKIPKSNKFSLDENLLTLFKNLKQTDSEMHKKGVLYLLCDAFDKGAEYKQTSSDNRNLLYKMFIYVDKNFDSNCSLSSLSSDIGYNYSYLSRYFKNAVGISFNDYVNNYRLNHSCYLLKNSSHTMLQCALESGFVSLRSFNRNFKQRFGITPTEYRNQIIKIHDWQSFNNLL